MEVKAKARYIKMSPQKVRLVIDVVRGLDTRDALAQLKFMNKLAATPVEKLISSAIANAIHNFELKEDNLFVKEIRADDGPTLKRWTPKAFGRAGAIRKRSSHITVVLGERVETKKDATGKKVKLAAPKKVDEVINEALNTEDITATKVVAEKGESQEGTEKEIFDAREKGKHRHKAPIEKKDAGGFSKKMFRRKSG